MDKQQYLNQISTTTITGSKPTSPKFFASTAFKIILGGLAALILVIILGVIISSVSNREKSRSFALKLHLDNLSTIINDYQPSVKSSALRSHSASLSGIISNTNRDLTDYLTTKYEYREKSVDTNLLASETALADELKTELFEAKINGLLDRTYARKMAYEISLLSARTSELQKSTRNQNYQNLLSTFQASLTNLYDKFNDFSETK